MITRKRWIGAQARKNTRLTQVSRMLVRLRLAAFLLYVALEVTSVGRWREEEDTVIDTLNNIRYFLIVLKNFYLVYANTTNMQGMQYCMRLQVMV